MAFDVNNLYEYKSALQKCIRRGEEVEAYYFASQLEEISPRQLWDRLKIIAVEDIGPGNTMLPILIDTLEKNYFELINKNNSGGRLFLLHAITTMCRSEKSRDNDNLLCYIDSKVHHEGFEIPVPDYALDKHTLRGKKLGRGWEHFFTEGVKLNNIDELNFNKTYAEEAKKLISKYGGSSEWKMSRIKKVPATSNGNSNGLNNFM